MSLLRDDERIVVERVRAGDAPTGWHDRMEFEMVRACAEVMAPRTVAIDDAVRDAPPTQVVILGAGLDGRAWRMSELTDAAVFEVDHPASQQDKKSRSAHLPRLAKSLHFVPVDFARDDLAAALASAGHETGVPTTWIWEGVVPYLTRREVTATVRAVSGLAAPGSRLIVNYQAPALTAGLGRIAMRATARLGRRTSPLRGEPNRSSWTPSAMRRLLERHGFAVAADDDLLSLAVDLSTPARQRRSLKTGRVVVADR